MGQLQRMDIFFFMGYAFDLSHSVVVFGGERIFYLFFFLSCPSELFVWFQEEILMNLQFLQLFTNRVLLFCFHTFLLCHLFHCQPLLFFTTLSSRKWQQEKNVTDETFTKLFIETKGKVYLFQDIRQQ